MNHKKSDIVVYVTKDYNIFQQNPLQPNNRTGESTNLERSIEFTNGNAMHPILVDEKSMQIIDGHRRLYVSRNTKTPVYYILIDATNSKELMRFINISSSNWSTKQFINHYSRIDDNYAKLEAFLMLQGSTFEMIKNFSIVSQAGVRAGMDISSLDYNHLDSVRKVAILISGIFDLRLTMVHRALRDLNYEVGDIDIQKLDDKIREDRRTGKYEKAIFVSNIGKLKTILAITYNRK